MMHNRIVNMLAAVGMATSALGFSKAFDRVSDRWNFVQIHPIGYNVGDFVRVIPNRV